MTKTVNLEAARNAYVEATTKEANALPAYAAALDKAIDPNWAVIAKSKVSTLSDAEKEVWEAVKQERETFTVAYVAGYTGKGNAKEIARVYWNRLIKHSLPQADKGAGATSEREFSARVREEVGTLIKAYYRSEADVLPDNADDINKALETAFILAGGDIVQLKNSMKS